MQFFLVLAVLFAFIVAVFAIQNATPVNITFLIWTYKDISLVLIIIAAILIGVLIMFFLGLSKHINKNKKIKSLLNQVDRLQSKLAEYEQNCYLKPDFSSKPQYNDRINEEQSKVKNAASKKRMEDTMSFKPPEL